MSIMFKKGGNANGRKMNKVALPTNSTNRDYNKENNTIDTTDTIGDTCNNTMEAIPGVNNINFDSLSKLKGTIRKLVCSKINPSDRSKATEPPKTRTRQAKLTITRSGVINTAWGDDVQYKSDKTFRVSFQNVNGIKV